MKYSRLYGKYTEALETIKELHQNSSLSADQQQQHMIQRQEYLQELENLKVGSVKTLNDSMIVKMEKKHLVIVLKIDL